MTSNRSPRRRPYSPAQKWVRVLYWVAVLVGIAFAYFNILPYTKAAQFLLNQTVDAGFARLIAVLPIINGIAVIIGASIHWILGFLSWMLIQTIELFPIILKHDQKFMEKVIQDIDSSNKFEIREDDDPALQAMKRWYNRFPHLTFSTAINLALFAYTVDFCIAFFTYPPVNGDLMDFTFVLATGQMDQIDWQNVVSLVVTLFVIEFIVILLLWLGRIAYYMKSAHNVQFRP